jgi:cytochrome c-type biogenesis protein CcmH
VAQLIAQLEERLQGDSADDPNGWVLYARSLMGLGRFEDALRAYDRVVALTDQNPDAVEERDRARAFVAQRGAGAPPALDARPQRGPTAQDVRDADAMSETDRAAMIQGMVDGLAARLESSPDDPAGWARLIRARQVMGDAGQAARDVQTVRELYADQPETLAQILTSAEWDG